jgi:hypothetical protein
MGDLIAYQILSLAAIRLLQRRETPYIKRLQEVRRVGRHAESDNLILLIVLLEIKRVIALIAVDNKQLISAYNSPFYMLIKVL